MARSRGSQAAAAMTMVKTTLTIMKPLNMKTTPLSRAGMGPNLRVRPRMYMFIPAMASCRAVNQP